MFSIKQKKDLIAIVDLCKFGKLNAFCTGDTAQRSLIDYGQPIRKQNTTVY